MNRLEIHRTIYDSPLGPLLLGASEYGLVGLYYEGTHRRQPVDTADWAENDSRFKKVKKQLDEYFAGERRTFDLAIDWEHRGTPFFHQVWQELVKIPYGETASYLDLAKRIGNPGAIRAVGMANARNPISIIVPCHRVIATNGKLTGYAGGLEAKQALLDLEGCAGQGEFAFS